jgi:hypothetical protein
MSANRIRRASHTSGRQSWQMAGFGAADPLLRCRAAMASRLAHIERPNVALDPSAPQPGHKPSSLTISHGPEALHPHLAFALVVGEAEAVAGPRHVTFDRGGDLVRLAFDPEPRFFLPSP